VTEGAAETALRTLERAITTLGRRDASDQERARALELAAVALDLVDVAARRRIDVDRQAAVVVQLERKYAALSAGDRRRAICRQLGISRSTYYRLRGRQSQSPETGADQDTLKS
jgi:hypothetical protein